jgi:hypothetical protein
LQLTTFGIGPATNFRKDFRVDLSSELFANDAHDDDLLTPSNIMMDQVEARNGYPRVFSGAAPLA